MPRDISISSAARWFKSWLHNCEENHVACKSTSTKLPSRILDISENITRLVEFREDEPPVGVYATLSHCWGEPGAQKPTRLSRDNLESRKKEIPNNELSAVFKDAIQLCREVGCYYIWIDSPCIIQGDELDWSIQSQKMTQIYSNAAFNIAATSSPDSNHSLFRERWSVGSWKTETIYHPLTHTLDTPSKADRPVFVRPSHYTDHMLVQGVRTDWGNEQAPLLSRAWVLQELLLARRTLHICSSELVWECRTAYDCECGSFTTCSRFPRGAESQSKPGSSHPLYRKHEFTRILQGEYPIQSVHDFWLKAAEAYSSLRLTKPSDRIAALDGLANAVQVVTKGQYLAGMWMEDLPRSLLWSDLWKLTQSVTRSHIAPSWSWMSRQHENGTCGLLPSYSYVLDYGFIPEEKTLIESFRTSGNVSEGSRVGISFRGPVFAGTLLQREDAALNPKSNSDFQVQPASFSAGRFGSEAFDLEGDCPGPSGDALQGGTMVEGLVLGIGENRVFHYILVVIKCLEIEGNYYKRIGIGKMLNRESESLDSAQDYFPDAMVRTIDIV